MDVTSIDDLAKATQALLLFVISFALTGAFAGSAVDAIAAKSSAAEGDSRKGFYRRKYAAVGALLAMAAFSIGTIVYADPKALDAAAGIVAAVSLFFAVCLIVEKLPFHAKQQVAAPLDDPVEDPVQPTPPKSIGLMSNEPAGRGLRKVQPVAEAPVPEPVEERATVPVGLADVQPETAEASEPAEPVEIAEASGKAKPKKGKKKKKKK